jgi:hypothetical protein
MDGGAPNKERDQLKKKINELEKILKEKDHHIWKLNVIIILFYK